MGVVGINLEDFAREKNGLYTVGEAVERIRTVMSVAREKGLADFVVNARTDVLVWGREMDEAIARGRAYLDAGATTVFLWGGRERGGLARGEVERAARELGAG